MDRPNLRVTRASVAREAALVNSSPKKDILSSTIEASSPHKDGAVAKNNVRAKENVKLEKKTREPRANKRRKTGPTSDDINELPHNLGRIAPLVEAVAATTKKVKKNPNVEEDLNNVLQDEELSVKKEERLPADITPLQEASLNSKKRAKANPYGLTPGETPFPDFPHPTPEECREVAKLLSKVHGEVKAPATIPAPSLTASGCGEVPSILDALIRTLLSAATTGTNSARAFKGLVDKFGLLTQGIGKGSVNWDNVRTAKYSDVFEAIKSGGLAATKSKRIQEILDMVYQENLARRKALTAAAATKDQSFAPVGAENETKSEKDLEITRTDDHVLSLDHLHTLSSDDALAALIKYPGIGPKTASCVLLFCMQRPSFAVDTHVFRLCKWLNWVPKQANRNTTYMHCEVRVPNELKYGLHQLFIRHGKSCPRCRAATGEGAEGWEKGCPIEHLVKRDGKRKGSVVKKAKGGAKKRKKATAEGSEESDDDVEASGVSEEDEES